MALPGLPKRLACGSTPLASGRMGQPVSVCQSLSITGTCSASLIHCAVGASSGSPASHRALRLLTLYLPNHCGTCFFSTRRAVGAADMGVTPHFSTILPHSPAPPSRSAGGGRDPRPPPPRGQPQKKYLPGSPPAPPYTRPCRAARPWAG